MRMRRAAKTFVGHGWPVMPGGYFNGERMACDRATCWATSCHPVLPDWEHHTGFAEDWWNRKPHSVLLPTGHAFDAIEVPMLVGSVVKAPPGPVIVTPAGHWIFLVRRGSPLLPILADRSDIVQHTAGSWIPAPPTVLPEGPVRWHVTPRQVGWRLPAPDQVQAAIIGALVALDATFLDRPLSVRPSRRFAHA
ncbi:DNA primase [Allorhizocola rhizosphaerae]|uniref:DNA primase n=1 Tax=Allorhizocola rhizosphaerae TaxID=1872709 RepID=UPI001B8C4343|nr:DNA primase [Allorhizocola rhizosphaerae]